MAFAVDLGCKNVIGKVMDMENRRNYEKRRKILEDNIIRLMMDKNLTARALSVRIGKNEWYITRMLNGKIDPSLDTLFDIAEALRVEPEELFTEKEGWKVVWPVRSHFAQTYCNGVIHYAILTIPKLIFKQECFKWQVKAAIWLDVLAFLVATANAAVMIAE